MIRQIKNVARRLVGGPVFAMYCVLQIMSMKKWGCGATGYATSLSVVVVTEMVKALGYPRLLSVRRIQCRLGVVCGEQMSVLESN